ncbi:tail sheath stabilizer and completion protein [Xanthomonas phage Xoo-sp13]|nr:tail sheath stabilizer and completion protein [Xanthomonas phage Xoo-sp13]
MNTRKQNPTGTYTDTTYSKSVDHYFFDGQIRKAWVQFAAIFSELNVRVGKNDSKSTTDLVTVQVKVGSTDRVVASILAGNTQNKPIRLPAVAVQMVGMDMAYDYIKGSNQQARHTTFPVGGTLPDDGKVVYKYIPFPYFLNMEASLLASNEDQHQQMLEQILLLFNPDLQLQISDGFSDWTAITHAELTGISMDTPYPSESDRRIISTTLSFKVLCYLSPAINIRSNYLKRIKLRIAAVNSGESIEDFMVEDNTGEYTIIADTDGIPPK